MAEQEFKHSKCKSRIKRKEKQHSTEESKIFCFRPLSAVSIDLQPHCSNEDAVSKKKSN